MLNDDDDVPPLEDMSSFLPKASTIPSKKIELDAPVQKQDMYTGLKKGFFDSKPKPKTKKVIVDNIPLIKPKNPSKNPLILDQVQKELPPQGGTNWMTPEFLDKIEKSPVLSKAFQDPMFTKAISEMTSNPEDAFKKYQKERPDLILALKEFSSIMSNQMSNVAISQIPKDLPKHEQELLKNVFSNSEIQDALKDEKIQKILSNATKDPLAITKALHDGPPEIKRKIELLFQAGILSTAT